ncbi:hydroxyacylglutathione hydrolase [Ferrimonas pelagia]|uniref:Hydroxyacylglutathione hydrolase n=1 Tax=Ferrimonas pelagia TaxID=1177826 RepID=A0ABP9EB68_9GAMM
MVDPGCAESVIDHLKAEGLSLRGILITHHHWDHTNGIEPLRQRWPQAQCIGPNNAAIMGLTQTVQAGASLTLEGLALQLTVLSLPGHTLDHIGYYGDGKLFCGDTLFSGGCGRLFEGSAEQMYASLQQLAALPGETQVYCTHEYTLANLAFACAVEPQNTALHAYRQSCTLLRQKGLPTLPSRIETELLINPFLRCGQPELAISLQKHAQVTSTDSVSRFAALRQWKDNF